MEGIHAIYKPKGPTSHDIVDQLRKITGIKKIGHAGTLDPLASGVLVVGIGRAATKQLSAIVAKEKEYLARIQFGGTSTTDDAEGKVTMIDVHEQPALETITRVIKSFIGEIEQIPPVYSAIKIEGQPAHRRTRKGEKVEMKPRPVIIKKIDIVQYNWPVLELRVITGPGVYIRSLARDIGQKLGVGGYLADLERVRVGDFTKETAKTLDNIN